MATRVGLPSTISVFLLFILKDVEMKKIWLTLAGLLLATQVAAAEFTEGKQYVALERPATARPEAIEFSPSTAQRVLRLKIRSIFRR